MNTLNMWISVKVYKVIYYLILTDLLILLYSDHNHTVSESAPTAVHQ